MTVKTKQMADRITQTIGPIFQEQPNYSVILDAMCIVMARVIQSAPDGGNKYDILNYANENVGNILLTFLEIERNATTPVMKAIDMFSKFSREEPNKIVPINDAS